jgi:hypothetical protein
MDRIPLDRLCDIVRTHGRSVIDEPAKCAALLHDHCSEYRREASVLVGALREGIPAAILESETRRVPVTAESLIQQLRQGAGFSTEAAEWAVDAWSIALGVALQPENPNPVTPAEPLPLKPPPLPSARPRAQVDAERWIDWGWKAGLISAGFTIVWAFFLAALGVSELEPPPWLFVESLQNCAAIVGLSVGVRQRSRAAAILLLAYHVLGVLLTWNLLPDEGLFFVHKLLLLPFIFFYARAIHATFVLTI